jgi:hypothetical protein
LTIYTSQPLHFHVGNFLYSLESSQHELNTKIRLKLTFHSP